MSSLTIKIKLSFLFLFILSSNILYSQNNIETDTLSNQIVVGIKLAPPFIIQTKSGDYTGVSLDLWEIIAQELDYNYKIKIYKQNEIQKMLKDVENNNIDVCINPLTVTGSRIQRFNFSQPFYTSNLAIAAPLKKDNSIVVFLKNFFSKRNLIAMSILFLVTCFFGTSIWLVERRKNHLEFRKGLFGIADGIWWTATVLSSIGPATKSPRTFLGRLIGMLWMFIAIITISLLIGSIASSLTTDKIKSDINSINTLKRTKIGTMDGSSAELFLENNYIPIAKNDFETILDGLKAVANNEIQAFIYDEPILKYLIVSEQLNDKVYILPYKLSTDYYSFAFPKKSELTTEINTVIVLETEKIAWKAILEKYNLN